MIGMTTRRHQTFVEIVDTFEQQSVEQRRRPLRAVRPDPVCVRRRRQPLVPG